MLDSVRSESSSGYDFQFSSPPSPSIRYRRRGCLARTSRKQAQRGGGALHVERVIVLDHVDGPGDVEVRGGHLHALPRGGEPQRGRHGLGLHGVGAAAVVQREGAQAGPGCGRAPPAPAGRSATPPCCRRRPRRPRPPARRRAPRPATPSWPRAPPGRRPRRPRRGRPLRIRRPGRRSGGSAGWDRDTRPGPPPPGSGRGSCACRPGSNCQAMRCDRHHSKMVSMRSATTRNGPWYILATK